MEHLVVVGRGAVAAAVAHLATKAGLTVQSLGRSRHLGPWCGEFMGQEFCYAPFESPAAAGAVCLAVKSFDLRDAALVCKDLPENTPVISLSNGYMVPLVTELSGKYPKLAWRLGSVTLAISSPEPDRFLLRSSAGGIFFGPLHSTASGILSFEQRLCGPEFHWLAAPAMRYAHQKKWLFNTVINSLSAVHGIKENSGLLAMSGELRDTFAEAYRAGRELIGGWQDGEDALFQSMLDLLHNTARNENSMARDIRLGRKTESDFLAGIVGARQDEFPMLWRLHSKIVG